MRRYPWVVLLFAPLLAGCERAPAAPAPPIDAVTPTQIKSATFGLG